MKVVIEQAWDLLPKEAIKLQKELASKVCEGQLTKPVRYVAGVDCAPSADKSYYYAAAVIWDLVTRSLVEYHIDRALLNFPYIPGLLSFREIPAILQALAKVEQEPDIIIVDGHGIAHPRRFGIASHLGVLLDRPTFGCGKSLLYGHYQEPPLEKGSISPLLNRSNNIIGNVIRTRTNVRPVIVSVGHKVDLPSATKLTLDCLGKFRLPEPTYLADKLVAKKQIISFVAEPLII